MKVIAFTRYGRLGASSRIRSYQYIPALHDLGIVLQPSPLLRDDYIKQIYEKQMSNWFTLFNDYLKQSIKLLSSKKYDLLWIEKELFPNMPAWFEQTLAFLGIPYVVDYDDAIFHNYDLSPNFVKKFLVNKIDKVIRGSALVVCGNDYLAERARSAGGRRVEIIPTVIDLNRYSVTGSVARKYITVGWIGSPSTVKYLDQIVPALQKLATEYPVRLRVIGASFDASGLDIDCRAWTERSEVSEIQNCDIGIMPLIDSPWERGKCGYKLIQYMACGLPVVASPVGVNQEIVRHGVNGYLATTAEDWLAAFRTLCADAQVRRALGAQGRLDVEQKYCLQVTAPRLAQLFHEVLAQRKT